MPAYREEAVIVDKVADLVANGYQGTLVVLVVADDPATEAAARRTAATVLSSSERSGKADALNRGVAAATSDIVIFNDANTRLEPGSLAAMARWFVDPSVGAVAGDKTVAGPTGEGVYWRFESWLKRREARTGGTVGLVGELAAVRRADFRPLPTDLAVDDLWVALDVLERGYRIAYEPTALAVEEPSRRWQDDWERRTRVVSGSLDVLWRRRGLLAPENGIVAVQLWGHRLVRSSFGPLAHLLLLLRAARASPHSRLAALAVAGHALGVPAAVRTQRRAPQGAIERTFGQALFLQAVALGGVIRYARGDRPALWPKPHRH